MKTGSKIVKGKAKQEKTVYKLTKTTAMKFRPEKSSEDSSSFITRFKSLSKFFSRGETPGASRQSTHSTIKKEAEYQPLCFLHRLDHQSYLVGNSLQLDAIAITTLDDYNEAEHLWSFKAGSSILKLLVDDRRRTLVLVVAGELRIYSYQSRRSKIPPKLQKSFRIIDQVKMMQLAKDSFLTVFFEKGISAFALDGLNSRQTSKKQFKIEKQFKIYRSAQCVENTLNIFFEKNKQKGGQKQDFFQLWCLPIEVIGEGLHLGELQKIYEINLEFRDTLKVESVNKQCYFMNLGQQLLLFTRGYKVDNVIINIQTKESLLKSFGDKKLIHIAPAQIDFYDLKIDFQQYPPRMTIVSTDSVPIQIVNKSNQFLDAIKFQEHYIGFFFQRPIHNLAGEVRYQFSLTIKWNFEEKVSSLLPQLSNYTGKYEGSQFEELMFKIEKGCDAVSKMGVSRKEAYLRVWSKSKKQEIEEFKLLLDTRDYATVREEILQKLRIKAMQFVIVQKIEMGCLGMLHQNLFAIQGFTQDDLKNYLTSNFLVRKLQLFKSLRLMQPDRVSLLSQPDKLKENPLMIDIQEYTTVVQMDLKAYLLELIYNMCKFKKDLVKQIRTIFKQFKFSFRSIYPELLKEIVITAKEDLFYLLKTIPELLPYEAKPEQIAQTPQIVKGVLSPMTQQEWDQALFMKNVATVYNIQMVSEYSQNLWVKRNWLTYHDMVFKTQQQLETQYAELQGEKLFLGIIQYIYNNFTDNEKIKNLINLLQDNYMTFPSHLYSNVLLYRELFLYFKQNNVLKQNFQEFLSKHDQEIFKKIFDHQKVKKGSLLRQIKPIYQNMGLSDKFNYGLLKFFSSSISELSDIKYLLNRINNEKREFHAQNEEMYEVLVKGMQIKLKLGSEKDIPINEVLIYIQNIPLTSGNPVAQQLSLIQRINKLGYLFQQMKLNMNIFQMVRNRDAVLLCSLAFSIREKGILSNHQTEFVVNTSKQILQEIGAVRKQIYGPYQDTILLFLYLVQLTNNQQLIPLIPRIIIENSTQNIPFTPAQLQSLVFFCYKRKVSAIPKYAQSKEYLQIIITLLHEDNSLRRFITNQLALASIFGQDMLYPICGESGVINKAILIRLIESLSKAKLLELDIQNLFNVASVLENIASANNTFTEHDLTEIVFSNMLRLGAVPEAVPFIERMCKLEPDSINNSLYPILIFRCLFNELTEENKAIMTTLLSRSYGKAVEMGQFFSSMFKSSWSNDGQKNMMLKQMQGTSSGDQFNAENMLLNDFVIDFLKENPDKKEGVANLLQKQFTHLIRSHDDFIKSSDILLMHLILLHNPILIIRYIDIQRYSFNFKEFRSFLSFLSKYELFDTIKVLEFLKRVMKVLYQHERGEGRLKDLIDSTFQTPITEILQLSLMAARNNNESKLMKGVDRTKAKLKAKMSSSALKKTSANGEAMNTKEAKFQRLSAWIEDSSQYLPGYQYPFYDSDDNIERKDVLKQTVFSQGLKGGWFTTKKWLNWFFQRTNQPIQYYLLKESESDIDKIMREQEEKLKLSFRASPKNRQLTDNAELIVKSVNQIAPPQKQEPPTLKNLAISNIPNVQSSAISAIEIVEELEEIKPCSTGLKTEIIASIKQEEFKVSFPPEILQKNCSAHLQVIIPEIIKEMYADQEFDYATCMMTIKEIHRQQAKWTPISVEAVDIYAKVEQLQKKLGLGLPIRELLPVGGLFVKEKGGQELFNQVKQQIIPHLNENNIHTLPRVISLSFKVPAIQQELNNQFFKKSVITYDQPMSSAFDQNLQLQKIIAFAQKMPIIHLKAQSQKLLPIFNDKNKQLQIIKAIATILRERNDARGAEQFEKKWQS